VREHVLPRINKNVADQWWHAVVGHSALDFLGDQVLGIFQDFAGHFIGFAFLGDKFGEFVVEGNKDFSVFLEFSEDGIHYVAHHLENGVFFLVDLIQPTAGISQFIE